MSETTGIAVPVDFGIRIPHGDRHIVLLDAAPVSADEQRALDALCDLLGAPKRPRPAGPD